MYAKCENPLLCKSSHLIIGTVISTSHICISLCSSLHAIVYFKLFNLYEHHMVGIISHYNKEIEVREVKQFSWGHTAASGITETRREGRNLILSLLWARWNAKGLWHSSPWLLHWGVARGHSLTSRSCSPTTTVAPRVFMATTSYCYLPAIEHTGNSYDIRFTLKLMWRKLAKYRNFSSEKKGQSRSPHNSGDCQPVHRTVKRAFRSSTT